MKTIAVVCEKGGTGKSVIANELYGELCATGRARVALLSGRSV